MLKSWKTHAIRSETQSSFYRLSTAMLIWTRVESSFLKLQRRLEVFHPHYLRAPHVKRDYRVWHNIVTLLRFVITSITTPTMSRVNFSADVLVFVQAPFRSIGNRFLALCIRPRLALFLNHRWQPFDSTNHLFDPAPAEP